MSYLLKIRKSSFRSPDRLVDASGRRYRLVEASAWNDRSRFKMGMKKLVESDHTLKAFLVKNLQNLQPFFALDLEKLSQNLRRVADQPQAEI